MVMFIRRILLYYLCIVVMVVGSTDSGSSFRSGAPANH